MSAREWAARITHGFGNRRSAWLPIVCLAALVAAISFLPLLDSRPDWPTLRLTPDAERSTPGRSGEQTAVVVTDALNVRQAASADSPILATHPIGQRVTVIGEPVAGFLPVRHGTGQGWMAARFLATSESTGEAEGERWIEVDRGTGIVTLHEGERVVATFTGKVGQDRSVNGYYATAPGTFHVYSMTRDLTPTPFAEDGYITDWVGFDPDRNNGFHSPIRDASGVERPVQDRTTKGCVRLDATAAERVFAFAYLGMRVEIHE